MKNEYSINGECVTIFLNYRNKDSTFITYVDLEDLDKIKQYNVSWHASWRNDSKSYYATATEYLGCANGKSINKTLYLHRLILDNPRKIVIDHINHNTLDNRKSNLRKTSQNKNLKHRGGKNQNNTSGYRNVSKSGKWWIVQLQIEGKNTVLGKFDDVDVAGKFAEQMREKYYGVYSGNG